MEDRGTRWRSKEGGKSQKVVTVLHTTSPVNAIHVHGRPPPAQPATTHGARYVRRPHSNCTTTLLRWANCPLVNSQYITHWSTRLRRWRRWREDAAAKGRPKSNERQRNTWLLVSSLTPTPLYPHLPLSLIFPYLFPSPVHPHLPHQSLPPHLVPQPLSLPPSLPPILPPSFSFPLALYFRL